MPEVPKPTNKKGSNLVLVVYTAGPQGTSHPRHNLRVDKSSI